MLYLMLKEKTIRNGTIMVLAATLLALMFCIADSAHKAAAAPATTPKWTVLKSCDKPDVKAASFFERCLKVPRLEGIRVSGDAGAQSAVDVGTGCSGYPLLDSIDFFDPSPFNYVVEKNHKFQFAAMNSSPWCTIYVIIVPSTHISGDWNLKKVMVYVKQRPA